jgi:hypothetical protein
MKNLILFLLLIISFSSCRVLKKEKTKEVKNDVKIVDKQTDNLIQVNEQIATEAETKSTNLQETETLETETIVEENFDQEGKLTNRITTTKHGNSKHKAQSQEVKKELSNQQFNYNASLTKVLKTFGQHYAATETKVKEVEQLSYWSYVFGAVIILIIGLVVYIRF